MTASTGLLALLAVARGSSDEKVLKLLIELGAQVVGASEGSLLAYDPEAKDLVFVMTVGGSPGLLGQRVPLDRGLTGLAAATGEVQIGAPTFKIHQDASGSGRGEPEAVIAAPMLIADDLVGVITAVSFTPGKRFTSGDADLYGRLASVAGIVVEQWRRLHGTTVDGPQASAPEQSIAISLARITRRGPKALARAAAIFAEVDGLLAETVDEA
jgi:hypothetical protein